MKVYCKYCTYLLINKTSIECSHSSNVIFKEDHTWYDKTKMLVYKKNPSVLNANNNCKLYEDKAKRLKELNK